MLVHSPLVFYLLCGSVAITAFPTSKQLEGVKAPRQANEPSSPLSIDLGQLDKDTHSLLDGFKSELSASRASASTTSPAPPSTSMHPTSTSITTTTHSTTTSVKPTTTSPKPTTTSSKTITTSPQPTTTSPKPTTTSSKPTTTTPKPTTTTPPKPTTTTSPKPTTTTTTTSPSPPSGTGSLRNNRPNFMVYMDESAFGFPTADQVKGFNVLILSFFLISGPADMVLTWQELPASQRQSMLDNYHKNGISLMASAFGSTDIPTTVGADPKSLAQKVGDWAVQFGMDGVDVDYEDFGAVQAGTAAAWLATFTTTLRSVIGPDMVLTHAPVAPWFGRGQPYLQLDKQVGGMIDWYNIQFYSQGTSYTTCDSLVTKSIAPFPGTSLLEIISAGVPASRLAIGKPGNLQDVGVIADIIEFGGKLVSGDQNLTASLGLERRATPANTNGFMDPSVLAQCLVTAKANGWNTGVMAWEYPDADATWIQTVRSLAFPVGS